MAGLNERQRQWLAGMADEALAKQDAAEAAAEEAERNRKAEIERRRKAAAAARKADEQRLAAACEAEGAARNMIAALKRMTAAGATVSRHAPGAGSRVDSQAMLRRFSLWLSRELATVSRSAGYFGVIQIHATGAPRGAFADGEAGLADGCIDALLEEPPKPKPVAPIMPRDVSVLERREGALTNGANHE